MATKEDGMVSKARMVLAGLLLVTMADPSLAQRTTATFAGIVTDPSGAVLPGAEVQMVNEGTSAVTQQLTGETGEFLFNFVPVGSYTLKIGMPGFKTYEGRGIPLGASQNVRRTYVLEVGNITDNVTVTGEAPMVNTLSPEQRFNLETLEVRNLPMINRNITNVLTVGSGLTKGEATANGFGGNRFRLNGLGGTSMTVTADGTDASGHPGEGSLSLYGSYNKIDVMSAESVSEAQVVKGVIPAEYGSAMAGSVSLIMRSGTNQWHGSLFHRYEGSVLSARNPILAREPNSVWNQFGGSLGGPIKRDRAFFFFAYEGYRQRTTVATTPIVPTPYFRDIMMRSLPFPETKIMLDYYPLPNQPYAPTDLLARWIGSGVRQNDDDHVDFKTDYLVGGGNFYLTFSGGHPYQVNANLQPLDPLIVNVKARRASANYVIGRGRWTSSTRAGYNQNFQNKYEKLWLEKNPAKPETIPGWQSVPTISYPGMTGLNREKRNWGAIPSWSLDQQVALLSGTHSWKFGGSLNLIQGGTPDSESGLVTYQNLQDLMQNEPASVLFNGGQPAFWSRMVNFGFFLQDDWRVNRKLVLNLGARYDRYGHYVGYTRYDSQPAGLFNMDGLIDAVNFAWGPPRDPLKPFENDNLSIGPRFGFAYTADSRGDFVVRGGFGVNFQGFDLQSYETQVTRPFIPRTRTFTRAESAALGLKWPFYGGDIADRVATEARARPQLASATRDNPQTKPPYAMNYTLGFQRALTSSLVLESAFVGTRGVKFNMTRTGNQIDRITGLRPNPNDIQVSYIDNSQQTNFNSWQTSLRQRPTHGLLYNVHYTWGKALSYTGGDTGHGSYGDTRGGIEDFGNVKIERSLSTGDVAHSVVLDWVYQAPTPFANSVLARNALGGWQISGIWRSSSGVPIPITQTGGRPDILDIHNAVNQNCCSYGNLQYLNPAAFQAVEISRASNRTIRRGQAGPAPLRGPGSSNMDLSLGKQFSLGESRNLEFKADLLNALNHTQYTDISTNLANIEFGQAIATKPARVIQLQLRLAF